MGMGNIKTDYRFKTKRLCQPIKVLLIQFNLSAISDIKTSLSSKAIIHEGRAFKYLNEGFRVVPTIVSCTTVEIKQYIMYISHSHYTSKY